MSFADDIAEKRREVTSSKATHDSHNESITAITDSGNGVIQATNKLAKSEDIDSVIKQLKEVQLATMLGAGKPSVILTDQTDLGQKIGELTDKLVATVKELDSSDVDSKQVNQLVRTVSTLDNLNGLIANNFKYADKQRSDIITAIKALKLSQVVNVPAPKVTVQPSSVDLSPLQDTIREYFKPSEIERGVDLDCYRAQDIDNTNANVQYVGFVNPEGNWYIIENDVKGNKLRYVFGKNGYAKAFSNAAMYTYLFLNEAVDALTT